MLSLSTSNKVTFNVNVSGTASTPSVRCVVGEYPAMSFPAVKLANGEWEVTIDLPAGTAPGAHPFKVEVLLNGRLFTPINYSITVGDEPTNEVPKPITSEPAVVPSISKIEDPDVPEPTPDVPVQVEQLHDVEDRARSQPKVVISPELWKLHDPMDMGFPDRGSEAEKLEYLLALAKKKSSKELGGLEKLVKAPVQKITPKAAPVVEVKRIKISMMDIANEAEKKVAKPVVVKPQPAIQEARASVIPVSVKKGAVVYR